MILLNYVTDERIMLMFHKDPFVIIIVSIIQENSLKSLINLLDDQIF